MLIAAPAAARADVPLPARFTVIVGNCPDEPASGIAASGCAYPDGNGTIYVGQAASPFTLWREIGHEFDYQMLTAGDRRWLMRAMHLHGETWDGETVDDDGLSASPAVDVFADAYADCQLELNPAHRYTWETAYGYEPTPRRHRAICRAMRRIGARR